MKKMSISLLHISFLTITTSSITIIQLLLLVIPSSVCVWGFDITKILGDYPDFVAFNALLSQTHLAEAANKWSTITVLALNNASVSSISGRDSDELKNILMNHIVLDYFDNHKNRGVKKRSSILTTLYQTTGNAEDNQGHINMTKLAPGVVVFGSAVKGSPLVANLISQLYTQPFNLSILHVTTPIVAPGQGKTVLPPPPPPNAPPPPSPPEEAPAPSPSDIIDDGDYASSTAPVPGTGPSASAPAAAPKKKLADAADQDDEGSAASSTPPLITLLLLSFVFVARLTC